MAKKLPVGSLIGLCCLIFFSPETGTASIGNIKEFLNTCSSRTIRLITRSEMTLSSVETGSSVERNIPGPNRPPP